MGTLFVRAFRSVCVVYECPVRPFEHLTMSDAKKEPPGRRRFQSSGAQQSNKLKLISPVPMIHTIHLSTVATKLL